MAFTKTDLPSGWTLEYRDALDARKWELKEGAAHRGLYRFETQAVIACFEMINGGREREPVPAIPTIPKLTSHVEPLPPLTPEARARYDAEDKKQTAKKEKAAAKPKKQSRAAKWADACARAKEALEELEELRGEFEAWRDNLPENLQGSALGEKLDAVADLDVQGAIDTVEEAEGLDLPLGFGRD